MLETTLCYLTRGDEVLMLHRVSKKNDVNAGKWIGVGGKLERDETPEACVLREVREETGLTLTQWQYRGIVDFESEDWAERMHLYTADGFSGKMTDCDEGKLAWIARDKVDSLSLWEGDRVFLRLLVQGEPFFRLKLVYHGETLTSAYLNGKEI